MYVVQFSALCSLLFYGLLLNIIIPHQTNSWRYVTSKYMKKLTFVSCREQCLRCDWQPSRQPFPLDVGLSPWKFLPELSGTSWLLLQMNDRLGRRSQVSLLGAAPLLTHDKTTSVEDIVVMSACRCSDTSAKMTECTAPTDISKITAKIAECVGRHELAYRFRLQMRGFQEKCEKLHSMEQHGCHV